MYYIIFVFHYLKSLNCIILISAKKICKFFCNFFCTTSSHSRAGVREGLPCAASLHRLWGVFFLPAQQRPYTGISFRFCFFFVTKELAFRRLACGSKAILLTKVMILPKSILLPKVISLPKVLAFEKGCLW